MGNDGASLLTESEWLTVRQAAAQLGNVSTKLVYKLFHAGELAGVTVAGTIRIRAASVAAYLEAHSNQKNAHADPAPAPTPLPQIPKRRRGSAPSPGFRFLPPRS